MQPSAARPISQISGNVLAALVGPVARGNFFRKAVKAGPAAGKNWRGTAYRYLADV